MVVLLTVHFKFVFLKVANVKLWQVLHDLEIFTLLILLKDFIFTDRFKCVDSLEEVGFGDGLVADLDFWAGFEVVIGQDNIYAVVFFEFNLRFIVILIFLIMDAWFSALT